MAVGFVNQLFKVFLALNSTFWVVVVFGIKEEWTISPLPSWVFGIFLLIAPVIMSIISILLTLLLDKDTLNDCGKVEEVNSSFLPIYLGYFFVGLGVGELQHLVFIYFIIFAFTYVAQAQYFNPMFLLFGYHFYNAETSGGTKIFLITKENLRRASEAKFSNLRRINNTTYIAWRENK